MSFLDLRPMFLRDFGEPPGESGRPGSRTVDYLLVAWLPPRSLADQEEAA